MENRTLANLSRVPQEQYLIQDEILQGKFGQPGSIFLTTRALAESRQVSVVTAHNILNGLCQAGYIELRGKKYYLSHSGLMEAYNSRKKLIGMMIPKVNNEFFSSLSDAVIQLAKEKGYRVLVVATSYSPEEEKNCLSLLESIPVVGIINSLSSPPEAAALYRTCEKPCVFLGHSLDKSKRSSVQVNSFSISQRVARHLLEEGYRKFLYIGSRNRPLEHDIRFAGFQLELKQNGYDLCADDTIRISTDSPEDEDLVVQKLRDQDGPVGVFCYHDLIAMRLYHICSLLGKRIPEDVGLVGFDDLSIATALSPPLTTIQYRITSMADIALSLLFTAIEQPDAPYDNFYVEPTLVIRKSSVLSSAKASNDITDAR